MQIDVSQLESEGRRVDESFTGEMLAVEGRRKRPEGVRPLSARLQAWVRPEGGLIRATGQVEAEAEASCDRCLKPVRFQIDGTFDQRYAWENPDPTRARGVKDEELELETEELDIEGLEGTMLDTAELAREQVVLATPIRVICAEECAGLCPTCGVDLNADACGCEQPSGDPRWDALKTLQSKKESENPDR